MADNEVFEMSENILRPCPFCGGEATVRHQEETYVEILCDNSDCLQVFIAGHPTKGTPHAGVFNLWNTRHQTASPLADIGRLTVEFRKQDTMAGSAKASIILWNAVDKFIESKSPAFDPAAAAGQLGLISIGKITVEYARLIRLRLSGTATVDGQSNAAIEDKHNEVLAACKEYNDAT